MATDCWWNQREFSPGSRLCQCQGPGAAGGGVRALAVGFGGSSGDLRASPRPLSSTPYPLLPQALCHGRGGRPASPGPSPGSAAALLQQNSILPALLGCLELTSTHESLAGLRLLGVAWGYADLYLHQLLGAVTTPALTESSQEGVTLRQEKQARPCRNVQAKIKQFFMKSCQRTRDVSVPK